MIWMCLKKLDDSKKKKTKAIPFIKWKKEKKESDI